MIASRRCRTLPRPGRTGQFLQLFLNGPGAALHNPIKLGRPIIENNESRYNPRQFHASPKATSRPNRARSKLSGKRATKARLHLYSPRLYYMAKVPALPLEFLNPLQYTFDGN